MTVSNLTPEPTDPRLATAEGVAEAAAQIKKLADQAVAGMKALVRDAEGAVQEAQARHAQLADEASQLEFVVSQKRAIEKDVEDLKAKAQKAEDKRRLAESALDAIRQQLG